MFPYWAVFAILALGAALEKPSSDEERKHDLLLTFAGFGLVLFIGLRYEVGGDWINYTNSLAFALYNSFDQSLALTDPGYEAMNWVASHLGLGLWAIDLVCASIFVWGLLRLARTQPRPWLVLVMSTPYLITVVANGYTRQAVAIGVVMASFASVIAGGGIVRSILYVTFGMFFHRTAIVLLPILSLATRQNKFWTFLFSLPAAYGLYITFVAPTIGRLVENYIEEEYASSGAVIRVALVVVGATVFMLYRKRLDFNERETSLWMSLSLAAFACLVLLVTSPSSTVVDRLALYLLPLQAVVLARIPGKLVSEGLGKTIMIAGAALTLFVWLNYAVNANWWLPYRNYLTEIYHGTFA